MIVFDFDCLKWYFNIGGESLRVAAANRIRLKFFDAVSAPVVGADAVVHEE